MKKYVQVGCGTRGVLSYAQYIPKDYADCAKLCGVYDINHKRAELVSKYAETDIEVFDDFDVMLETVKPDTVIVTPKDSAHDDYVIRAMRAGCDVIVEKPLTTTFEKALEIKKVQEETGREVIVTFNLRFHPFFKRVKEILDTGCIGKILSVHYEWMLDTHHGADYFRRWHRERKNSGSLLVHKSTHHFDLINWYLGEDPLYVNAFGTRRFYGPTRDERSERCLTCPYKKSCEFYFDITKDADMKAFYYDCEDADGYYRDKCVFSEEIDIEDSLSLNISYSGGAIVSYSLTAHSPYEGMRLILNGTKGRMEIQTKDSTGNMFDIKSERSIKIFDRKGTVIDIAVPEVTVSGHGGADEQLRDRLFAHKNEPDPLCQMASTRAGLMSIGIGMAANVSLKENRRVALSEYYEF